MRVVRAKVGQGLEGVGDGLVADVEHSVAIEEEGVVLGS